ncbi:MAG: hypothetical protein IJG38_09315 [Thermoguttaceae bacterium]|nr:hypothetical protein [Thermoguttaceae bacterium]
MRRCGNAEDAREPAGQAGNSAKEIIWRLPPQSVKQIFTSRTLRTSACGFFGGLRPRPGDVFGCGADSLRVFGQGGGKPPQSPPQAFVNCFSASFAAKKTAGETPALKTILQKI